MRLRTLAAAALLATALAPTVPAHADDAEPSDPGLFLTVSGSQNTWIRGVRLHCPPEPGDHHPKAVQACAVLDLVDGDLDALPQLPMPCTLEYDPVTVSATGTHRGHAVSWRKTYANPCALKAHTGPVFDF